MRRLIQMGLFSVSWRHTGTFFAQWTTRVLRCVRPAKVRDDAVRHWHAMREAPVTDGLRADADLAQPWNDDDLGLALLIRYVELTLLDLFAEGKVNGTVHTCLGQEHIPVLLRPLLDERDFVLSNHRGHGHYLARFRDPEGLLAEILGRTGAVCNGVGGSQHILRDRYLSTGIQGQSLPVAVGLATALARSEPGRLVCAHVGDGTWGQGAVYEAVNLAALWKSSLLVAVENNGIAQSTPTSMQLAGSIAARAAAFGIHYLRFSGTDIAAARASLVPALQQVRSGAGPLVVEFDVPRVGPHSKGDDTRSAEEIALASERDWATRYRAAHPEQYARCDAAAKARVQAAVADVLARPPSRWPDGPKATR
jgi:pyruvate dehydrogenase E1 component alpha subunit